MRAGKGLLAVRNLGLCVSCSSPAGIQPGGGRGAGGRWSRESEGPAEGRGRAGGEQGSQGYSGGGRLDGLKGRGRGGSRRFRGRLKQQGRQGSRGGNRA